MFKISGFHGYMKETGIDIIMNISAGVIHADNVCSEAGNNGADTGQFSRTVQKFQIQFRTSAGSHKPPVDNTGKDRYINIPAGNKTDNIFAPLEKKILEEVLLLK